ncbi:DUF4132 domain-containing protein [Virgisporangium aurantiacum]|uniref:DUF4132 domain-containing protein n=1 Tax=Virgisporangium aurantiacum TaxID=175570 RepID=A0A8J3ZBX4_9ACTN|nr:DUF4132 domain-containing protein [Virgisporangium aurantiacum]GIJ58433.1 hypothetical protein Vau01_059490 [Virgisporangium aurantiacum]
MDPLAGLRMGACADTDNPRQLILGIATHDGSAVAVGGQGRSLAAVSSDGYAFHPVISPGRGLRGALLREDGLWVVGEYGYIARSTDRGHSWRQLTSGTGGCLFGVVADRDGRLWVAGDNGYLASSTDGEKFRRVSGVDESIARISDSPLGVLVPTDRPGRLYVCRDRSVRRLNLEAGADLMSATVTPTGTILTVGVDGLVFRSDDAGESFQRVPVPADSLLTSVRHLPDGRVVIVGAAGLVLVSADDGRTFVRFEQFVSVAMLWCCEPFGSGLLIGDGDGTVSWLGADRPAAAGQSSVTPTERRDGVHVSPWLRSALYPRRGGIPTEIRPLPALDEAWAALRRAFWATDRYTMVIKGERSGIWNHATSDHHHRREIGERILDPRPRSGTAEEDIRLVELVFERYNTFVGAFRAEIEERVADFLVASVGLPGAARRMLAGIKSELPYVGAGPFGRLRELLVLAGDAEYAEARSAILDATAELAPTSHTHRRAASVRWATTFLLPLGPAAGAEERRVHEDALRHLGEFGNCDVHASAIAAGDLATLERFIKANRKIGHQFFAPFSGGRMYLASVLEIAGSAAGEVLARLKPGEPWERDFYHNDLWCRLLAHVDDEHTLAALLRERRDGHRWGTAGLLRAAGLDPDRVRRFARENGDDELLALVGADIEPGPVRPPAADDDAVLAGLGAPVDYVPPPARRGRPLRTTLAIEPVQSWRDEEIEAAQRVGAHDDAVTWNGVSVARCDAEALEAFVANRERWAVPTGVADLALTPARVHDRLLALGFAMDYYVRYALVPVLYRGGLSHLPLLHAALAEPDSLEYGLQAAQPFGDVSIVPAIVKAFAGKKNKAPARSWILRHPRHAAAGALTLWAADRADTGAARVLRYLDARGHRATILGFAADLDVDAATLAMLDADPLTAPGAKRPPVPAFAAAQALPPLVPVPGTTAPDADLLLVQLAWSNADEVHPGVLAAKAGYTPASRAAFAWALFEAWLAAGAPPKASWCMQAVGLLGDDDCARRLTALARKWPGENAAARAQAALDALLNIGTDTALININLLAEKSRFPAFAAAARERIDAIAYSRGLTTDELADRLVPTLGLDEDGADVLDTGSHTYRIVFDANLLPVLRDANGALLPDLPRPGKNDDKQRMKAAKARLTALRKDARASATLHLSRIERAMCTGRAIGADVFLDRYARHPWMRHLAERLVWGVAELPVTFRVAEDGTLADIDDKLYELPRDASVVVLHPLDLAADAVPVWSQLFADYEILQPFPQLARPVFRAADTGRAAGLDAVLARLRGHTVTYGQLRGLEARGWQKWHDSSVQMAKPLGGKLWAILETDPGWHATDTAESVEPQHIEGVTFHGGDAAELDPRTYSELVYDLDRLV